MTAKTATTPPADPNAAGFWIRHLVPATILLVVPFALYGTTWSFGFVLDDKVVLSENSFTKSGFAGIKDILTKDTFQGFFGAQTQLVQGGRYRPLSLVTFAIEHQLYGLHAGMHHLINVLLYALTGLLLFRVLSLLLPAGHESSWCFRIPFLASLLFVVHPVHSEVVANIKGRDELLALLLSMSALYAAWRWIGSRKRRWLVAGGALFFLALLAKENALTFLAVVPLAAYCFARCDLKRIVVAAGPLCVAAVLYLAVRYGVMGYLFDSGQNVTGLLNNPFLEATLPQKLATICYVLFRYLQLLFFPHPLTHDYYPYHIPLLDWSDPRSFGSLLFYVLLVRLAAFQLRHRTVLAFSVFYFLATLSIVSNLFFSVGTFMNERFAFMPSVGFVLLLAWVLIEQLPHWLKNRALARSVGIGIVSVFVLAFAGKTLARVPVWKDATSLNRAAIKVSPNSARANTFYAVVLYDDALAAANHTSKKQLLQDAKKHLDRSLRIYPTYLEALRVRARVMGQLYPINKDLDALLALFEQTLLVEPLPYIDQYMSSLNRQWPDVEKVTAFYHRAGLEILYRHHQRADLGVRYLRYGLQLNPDHIQLLLDLCRIHYEQEEYATALQYARRGLTIQPGHGELRNYRDLAAAAEAARPPANSP